MAIPEIDGTSTQNPGQDGAIIHEDAEAEPERIGGDGEHGQKPAGQGVQSDEVEVEDQAPAAAPSTSAGAKKIFGIRRPNPTAKKGNDALHRVDYGRIEAARVL